MTEQPPSNDQPTPTPPYEAQRLRDLYSLKVLDTESDERFERYVQFAADLLEMPIALISLIDRQYHWLKAATGLQQQKTQAAISLCTQTVSADQPLMIKDAARRADKPAAAQPGRIRSFVGIPLHGASQLVLGTLCVADHRPRTFTEHDLQLLKQLVGLVESELQQEQTIKQLRSEIERNAYFDSLTSLPNRRLLTDRLDYVLQLAAEREQQVTVTLFDLDSFSTYNKIYGREVGDKLLQAIAGRMTSTFPPPNVVGRWRDDQFMLITTDKAAERRAIGEHVLESLSRPFQIDEHTLYVSAKIGVSAYPDDAQDSHDLIQRANAAMRSHRTYADSKLTVYAPSVDSSRVRRHDLLRRLRKAISSNEVTAAFQPEMNIRTGRLQGAEALLRWHDQELGSIPAMEAASAAEHTSTIHLLGEHILRTACQEAAGWRRAGTNPLEVAVNLAAPQLHQPRLLNQIASILEETGLAGSNLVLELTETTLIEDIDTVSRRMQALKPLGIRFAIDDFGTGYSSFTYLAQLPVNRLKIDKSFISQICTNSETTKIVTGLVDLAHRLHLDVVAEGVETAEQLDLLRRIGCDLMQGYYYSLPLSAEEFREFSRAH